MPPSRSATKVLFFSRGRGRGHAIPDIAIADALGAILPAADVHFASYGTGAATLKERGCPVTDLGLPEDNPFLETLIRCAHLVAQFKPDIVVSHEEYAALPAARTLGVRTCFIVDFFPPGANPWNESLAYADEILFIERQGMFAVPPPAKGRVRYIGPVVRSMSATRSDRDMARATLALPRAAHVLSVIPGAWATERRAPIVDVVGAAVDSMARRGLEVSLAWVAGEDREAVRRRFQHDERVTVLESLWPIETLMVASDLVITKGNRGTTIDLASLGIPSVSLSHGLNPIDEVIVPRIRTNLSLDARGLDGTFLADVIETRLLTSSLPPAEPDPDYVPGGAVRAAEALARFITEASSQSLDRACAQEALPAEVSAH